MAEDQEQAEDRTEEATPERRDEFRERGQIAVSKELVSVLILASSAAFLSYYMSNLMRGLMDIMEHSFLKLAQSTFKSSEFLELLEIVGWNVILYILPMLSLTAFVAIAGTFFQTRFNVSFKKLKPDFSRMNILKGVAKMVSVQSSVELLKGIFKMIIVGATAFYILKGSWNETPNLVFESFEKIWSYWGSVTSQLFWSVAGLLLFIAIGDYAYNFASIEKKLKMTKKEVREDMKRREVDPHIRGKLRQRAREIAMSKVVQQTEDATVLITNPTHYSIAIKYELGMKAPIVLAKGVDFLALRMREVANEKNIPIVENKPLARAIYRLVDMGDIIPESLYKAVSEVIKYVFKLKNISVNRKTA